jgi:TonB family protein
VEGANLSPDWIAQLQAWWDLRAYYPMEASEKKVSGTVKVHLLIHQDGQVWLVKVAQGSGAFILDQVAFYVFHGAHLRPFPPGTPAPEADICITLHFVLGHQPSKKPFTITNDPVPVQSTAVNKMMQKTCTGTAVEGGWGPHSSFGVHRRVNAIFYRDPDGKAWVHWWYDNGAEFVAPVTELGVSAQWNGRLKCGPISAGCNQPHYAVWATGPNSFGGSTVDPEGSVDLACHQEQQAGQ